MVGREHEASRLASAWLVLVAVCLPICIGCAGYQIGQQTLYRNDVRTVHVPVFESDSFRRNLGERLTEAVIKEIELKTPYKVVSASQADSVLLGRIVSEAKGVVAEDANDNPRVIQADMIAQIEWRHRGGEILGTNSAVLPHAFQVYASNHLIPEGGQSIATSHQAAIDDLARHIVAQMELPW
jgi:hypothetical protein